MRFFGRRSLIVVVAVAALSAAAARAQPPDDAEMAVLRSAVAAGAAGNWQAASAAIAAVKDPLAAKILDWLEYARPGGAGSFADIARFIEENPDWPGQAALRAHAEEALAAEPDAVAAAWLDRHPPVSAAGRIRAAELRLAGGDAAGGTAALRAAWVDCDFGPADENKFLARHGDAIRPEDDWRRLDRLLWRRDVAAAVAMLPRVDADHRVLAEARLALAAGAANAPVLIARVPAPLRGDPGLVYEEVRALRRKDMTDAAAALLVAHPSDPVHPAAWAVERQAVARQLLAAGDFRRAFRVIAGHGAITGDLSADAEFLQGFIALRYMKDPVLALAAFSRILGHVESPWALARAGYWGGRTAAAEGEAGLAAAWYAMGARYMVTFYGQLAAHQLGDDAPPHPMPEPVPSPAERARFDALPLVRADRIFFALGDRRHAQEFLRYLAAAAASPTEFAMLADLAERHGRTDLAIAVARRAIAAGTPLLVHGYPTIAIPAGAIADGGDIEHALLYAIMRQESGFAADAVSRAGALGLMQLMPATASFAAAKVRLPFSLAALTADGPYNITLGRTYLEQLLRDFGGSYALAIAAYNAGPGRVREWLVQYGDPRGGAIDMVSWIELIPITETRRYVERVLENLQVYRGQEGRGLAFSLVSDLAR